MFDRNSPSLPANRVAGPWITPLLLAAFFLAAFTVDSRAADPDTGQAADGAELSLYDSITFDIKLSSALGKKLPAVTVRSVAPFTLNQIPERIDKWLDAVRKHGGQIELKPDPDYPASRDFGLIYDLLSKAYDLAKEALIYRKAENYHVDVLYKPASGEVTRFVFTLKEGAA